MSRQEDIDRVMRDIHRGVDGVDDVVVATSDGLAVASTNPGPRADKVAAMAASVVALSQQTIPEDGDGNPHETVIRGSLGCLVVRGAGPNAVIAVRTGADSNMGLVHLEIPRAAAELESILA